MCLTWRYGFCKAAQALDGIFLTSYSVQRLRFKRARALWLEGALLTWLRVISKDIV